MVTRPNTFHKTPPTSRGTSPSRIINRSNKSTPAQSPNRSNRSSQRSPSPQFDGSPTRRHQTKREKPISRSRGNSPLKIKSEHPESRGSDCGSIDRLDDDNNVRRMITSYNQIEDNINVVVRVRPLNTKETRGADLTVVQFPGNGQVMVDGIPGGPSGGQKPKLFSYNVVFEPAATQEDILQFSGMKRLIDMAVEGFRCTCFCYGQTGSGKTHTLTGPPRLVIDLLNPGSARKPLAVRWSKKARGFFVENLFTVDCEELDDLIAVLEEGLRNRSVGKHNMNDFSSRSHTILTVHITSEQPAENGVFLSRSGKINFVDLAGSEMTKKTQSEGKTLEEANNINKSLMVLGYCISSLSDSKRKHSHIPYRDSKLTKLLADSLAGNGATLMIACISPAKSNITETLNTLRYAARAKKIRTKPVVLMDPREALILSLKREVIVLQSENEHLRSVLRIYSGPADSTTREQQTEKRSAVTPPHVNPEKLGELECPELTDLVRLYMTENEALRNENYELFTSRETLHRDHEIICHENERLLRKLEEVNSSPLIPVRPAFSADILSNTDTDTSMRTSSSEATTEYAKSIPESIQKELEKRQLGNNASIRAHRRQSSWDDKRNTKMVKLKSSESTENINIKNQAGSLTETEKPLNRRFSVAKEKTNIPKSKQGNSSPHDSDMDKDVFGSTISLIDDEDE